MKVILLDPLSVGVSHVSFNETMTKAILKAKSVSSVHLILSQTQLCQKRFNDITSSEKVNSINALNNDKINTSRFIYSIKMLSLFFRLLFSIKKNKPNTLFLLAADNFYSPIFLLLIKTLFNLQIKIVLHNNIENIKSSTFKIKLWSLVLTKNVTGIILSKFVLNHSKQLFNNKVNIKLLPHPSYEHIIGQQNFSNNQSYKSDFLVLGRHSEFFYQDNFYKSFCNACSKIKTNDNTILIIRKTDKIKASNSIFSTKEYQFPLTDNDYWQMLNNTKFVIIPPQAAKRITASGVHIDALSIGTPVIAPNIGTFKENVPKIAESLLYDENSIEKTLIKALELTDEKYLEIKTEVKTICKNLNLTNTTENINHILNDN